MNAKFLILGSLLAFAALDASACYTVYDKSNRMIYNSPEAPVDMRRQLHETMPAAFPGGHMVFDSVGECPFEAAARPGVKVAPRGAALLTDRRTATTMNSPYAVLSSGVVVVDTSVMGAPAASR